MEQKNPNIKMILPPKNVFMLATTFLPIKETFDRLHFSFNGDSGGIEKLQKVFSCAKLYMRIFNDTDEKNMIVQSNLALEKLLDFEKYEERFYFLGNELRKIEVKNKKTNEFLLIIKRDKVYIPTEYSTTSRIDLVNNIMG